MNTKQSQLIIHEKTGIPITLLDGETPEENVAKARELLKLRRPQEAVYQTTRDKFAQYMAEEYYGEEYNRPDEAAEALNKIEKAIKIDNMFAGRGGQKS